MNSKSIISIFCVVSIMILWLYRFTILPLKIDLLIETIVLSIFPLYALILVIVYLDEKRLKRKFLIADVLLLHTVISFGFMMVVFILALQFFSQKTVFSSDDARKKIIDAYKYAEFLGGDAQEETRAYITYYHNNKDLLGEIDFTVDFIEGIEDIKTKRISNMDRKNKEFYSTLITADIGNDAFKENLVFRIENFLTTGNFESASILLSYYKVLYGVDDLVMQVQEKVDTVFSDMDDRYYLVEDKEFKNYYDQLKYFYYLIEKKDVEKSSLLLGYFILQAFMKNTRVQKQEEIAWVQDKILERINKTMFFASKARLNLFDFDTPKKTIFIVDSGADIYIWSALDNQYNANEDTTYFNKLNIFSFSKIKREIQWHIRTEYAVLKSDNLYVFGIETGVMDIVYKPEIIYKADYVAAPSFLKTGIFDNIKIMPAETSKLQPRYDDLNTKNIMQLIAVIIPWIKYKLPINMFLEVIYQKLLVVLMFFVYGIFFIGGFAKIAFDNMFFKSGAIYITVLITGFLPSYGILKNIGILILRNTSDIPQWSFILLVILASVIAVIKEITRINYSKKRKKEEDLYLFKRRRNEF